MEKEVSESDRKAFLKGKYIALVNKYLDSKHTTQEEVYQFIRNFFSEFLKINYEFTYEELTKELNKIYIKPDLKKEIDDFLLNLSKIEYLYENDLEQEDIKELLEKIKHTIEAVIIEEKSEKIEKKQNLLEKMFKKNGKKETPQPLSAVPYTPITTNNTQENVSVAQEVPAKKEDKKTIQNTAKQNIQEETTEQISIIEQLNSQLKNNNNAIIAFNNTKETSKTKIPARKTEIKTKNIILEPEKINIENKDEEIKQNNKKKTSTNYKNNKFPSLPLKKEIQSKNVLITENNAPSITNIYTHIDKAYVHLNVTENDYAKKEYKDALSNYHFLTVDEKKECYQVLYELYLILKNK